MQNISRLGLAVAMIALGGSLAGCGGGGGGSGGASTAQSATPTMAITADNGQQVAAQAFSGTGPLSQGAAAATSLKATGATMTGQSSVLGYLANFAAQQAQSRLGAKSSVVAPIAAKAVNETATCSVGGSYVVTGNVSDSGQPAVGNTLTATFSNCNDGTETINGSFALTLTGLNQSADGSGGSASMTMNASNFSVATANSGASLNGSLSISVQIVAINNVAQSEQVNLTSPQMTLTSSNYGSLSILGLNYTLFNNLTNGTWWFSQDEAVNNNGQVFSVQTTQKFAGAGCAYPSSGSATITGSKSSEVVTAMSGNQTQLQIDANGDNAVDVSQTVPSSSVFALICLN